MMQDATNLVGLQVEGDSVNYEIVGFYSVIDNTFPKVYIKLKDLKSGTTLNVKSADFESSLGLKKLKFKKWTS